MLVLLLVNLCSKQDCGEISPELHITPNRPISSLIMQLSPPPAPIAVAAGDETIELRVESKGSVWSIEIEFSQLELKKQFGNCPCPSGLTFIVIGLLLLPSIGEQRAQFFRRRRSRKFVNGDRLSELWHERGSEPEQKGRE